MTETMRVVLVSGIFPPDIGGPATHASDLQDELMALGHQAVVVTLWDGLGIDRRPGLVRFPRRWRWPKRLAAVTAWLVKNRNRYDVVYATGLHPAAVAGARMARRPVVVKIVGDAAWERGRRQGLTGKDFDQFQAARDGSPRIRAMRKLQNWSLRRSTAIVTPSEYLARIVEGWLEGPANIRVIANGVRRPAVDRPFDSGDEWLRTIFVGRLVAHKRVGLLLEALAATPGVGLEIVGEGPERAPLEDRARELGVRNRVTFTGALPHDEVLERMARTHALLLVSDYEGLPHVAIEALTSGVPLVALLVGGTGSVLHDGENGIVLQDASPQAIAQALKTLRDDAELRRRLADGARRSSKEWGMDRCVAQVVDLLKQAIYGRPRVIFLGKSNLPSPITHDFRRKLEVLVRHLEPTIVGVGPRGVHSIGRAKLLRFPSRRSAGLDGLLFYSFAPALSVLLAAGRRRCAIVCQSPYEAFGVLLLVKTLPKSLRPRVVVEVHGDWRTASRLYGSSVRVLWAASADRVAEWALRRADRVRVIGSHTETLVRQAGYRRELDRFITFSDFGMFLEGPPKPLPTEPSIACVAALEPYKGVDVLLEAWSQVVMAVPKAQLRIVGEGSMFKSLRRKVQKLGIGDSVEFLGGLSRPEVKQVLDRSWLLVLPSRAEGLGRVILEAFARGRPVVGSNVGGIPELIEEGRNGLLVAPEDPEQLAGAIIELLQAGGSLVEMGQEGRRGVLELDPVAEFESGISRLAAWAGAG